MRAIRNSVAGIFLGALFLCGGATADAAEWTLYYKDGVEMNEYDKASVVRPRPGVVQVSARVTSLGSQEGQVRKLELSCKHHMLRELSNKVDPITGAPVPEGGQDGYRWVDLPYASHAMALYENLCE
jgi:hypothetical protein